MNPKVSVIVPVYNTEKYIARCIESILNQSFKDYEIILIDDGSSDNSGNICDYYSEIDNRIKVIHIENNGVSFARNYAINISNGKYITFIDSDDIIDSDMLKTLYELLINNEVDMALCSYKGKDNISLISKEDKLIKYTKEEACDMFFTNLEPFAPSFVWGRMIKKSLLKERKFREDIFLMEDALFNIELILNCNNGIIFTTKQLYYYIQREGTASNTFNKRRISSFYALEEILLIANKVNKKYEDEYLKIYSKLVLNILQDIIKYDFDGNREIYYEIAKKINKRYFKNIKSKDINIKNKVHLSILFINSNLYKYILKLL